jgi:hypothetical protein
MARFAKGMKVWKTFHGVGGYTEEGEDVVESVKSGVVRTRTCEGGITFDATTGRELENFFPPMYQSIIPLSEKGQPAPKPAKPRAEKKTKKKAAESGLGPPLTPKDVANPMFDWQAPRWRTVSGRPAIEWGTFTDEYIRVGCTYFSDTGQLTIVCGQPEHLNVTLYDRTVQTQEQFAKAMKAVDGAYKKLSRLSDEAGDSPKKRKK